MKPTSLILVGVFLLFSCDKEEKDSTFNVKGFLRDSLTQQPIKGVYFNAYTYEPEDIDHPWNGGLTVRIQGTGSTDSNGVFKINFNKDKLDKYYNVYLGCDKIPFGYKEPPYFSGAELFEIHDNGYYYLYFNPK